ncbi:MAG TPA: HDOD domain-containing protein [Fimbriimonadales bacterium]|nr:HDOD domain-containing protein [Fimbriimonadales bacterium]
MSSIPNPLPEWPDETHSAIEAILEEARELAALPQVVYKVIQLTGSNNSSAQEIERVISIDPGFSSKVLILANSAFYALPRKLTSIREATTFLGFRTIRQLALTVGAFDLFLGKADIGSLRRRDWWRHSVDSAVCCKVIAEKLGGMQPEDAYTCGLLHDIGKPLLDRSKRASYSDVEQLVQGGASILDAEKSVYGCNHTEIGAAAAKLWNLPRMVIEVIEHHHAPNGFSLRNKCQFLNSVAITAFGSEIAHALGKGNLEICLEEWVSKTLSLSEDSKEQLFQHCKDAVAERSSSSF